MSPNDNDDNELEEYTQSHHRADNSFDLLGMVDPT